MFQGTYSTNAPCAWKTLTFSFPFPFPFDQAEQNPVSTLSRLRKNIFHEKWSLPKIDVQIKKQNNCRFIITFRKLFLLLLQGVKSLYLYIYKV